MDALTLNTAGAVPGSATANLVAAIVRAVRASAQTATADPTAAIIDAAQIKLGSILNLLLNPKNGAALMDINLDQLVNNSALQNVLRQLPPELLSKPQVFEALVLQNTLLPAAQAQTENASPLPLLILPQPAGAKPAASILLSQPEPASQASQPSPPTGASQIAPLSSKSSQTPTSATSQPVLYRVTLEWQNRLLLIVSPQPFPNGARLQLQSNARGEIKLLASTVAAGAVRTPNTLPETTAATRMTAPASTMPPPSTPLLTLQQSVRELLPRQQALHTLVPLLQKFLQSSSPAPLPQPIARAVAQLLRSLPRAEQMQDASALRQAIKDSGSFFESRLPRAPANAPAEPEIPRALLTTDIKAQITALLGAIRTLAPNALAVSRAQPQLGADEFVYSHKPGAPHASAPPASGEKDGEAADSVLTQLGKLLQAGLARIQLNQLDSASARQINTDAQAPIPTWVVEMPLRTPYGADQLQLRIEQRPHKREGRTRQQWSVHIALDLHAAGKLAATLNIVEKSVAATLWAEHEQTHRAVRDEMDYLRAGLESVGVKVTEMQCRHGVPPTRSSALTQRLVDVHT
jgi:hypothetical protein